MKKIIHMAVLFLGVTGIVQVSRAELKVTLKIEPVSAVEFEAVKASVTVRNDGETDFVLDESDKNNKARAVFRIERKADSQVARLGGRSPLVKMILPPGEKREFVADLSLLYDIATNGRYVVKAVIDLDVVRYESNPVILDVVRAVEIASVTKAVPGYPDIMRKYSLRYHSRAKKDLAFLCVEEDGGKVNCGTFSLGPIARIKKPTLEAGRAGSITVIHQLRDDCFVCSKFKSDKDGVSFVEQTYHDVTGKLYQSARKESRPSE